MIFTIPRPNRLCSKTAVTGSSHLLIIDPDFVYSMYPRIVVSALLRDLPFHPMFPSNRYSVQYTIPRRSRHPRKARPHQSLSRLPNGHKNPSRSAGGSTEQAWQAGVRVRPHAHCPGSGIVGYQARDLDSPQFLKGYLRELAPARADAAPEAAQVASHVPLTQSTMPQKCSLPYSMEANTWAPSHPVMISSCFQPGIFAVFRLKSHHSCHFKSAFESDPSSLARQAISKPRPYQSTKAGESDSCMFAPLA